MKRLLVICLLLSSVALVPRASAHCDSINGPVVKSAQVALERGDVTPVLKWVREEDEAVIREAFRKTLIVRRGGTAAAELADMYFFETLVRIHRAGEGEPYTGLKSGDVPTDPGIEAADQALESGDLRALMRELHGRLEKELHARFDRVVESRKHAEKDVRSGRAFVADYVKFIHYAEGLFLAARGDGGTGPWKNDGGHQHH